MGELLKQMQSNTDTVVNPQLIKLNVDMLTARKRTFLWILFAIVILFFYVLTLAIPDALRNREYIAGACPVQARPDSDACKPFDLQRHPVFVGLLTGMTEYHNFIFLKVQPIRKNTTGYAHTDITLTVYFDYTVNQVAADGVTVLQTIQSAKNHTISIKCLRGNDFCEERVIVYEPSVKFKTTR
eukprot:TRINITY_DN4091_c0_g1_i20.p2 TRINITY_DN4091_c0_g1~~TRINITY_DN4091_c0_g1_i20.p2  ORF type:complete len:197 (+),score=30.86 TRINITY_DN4091_c0_g1_i20:40-591(+)